MADLNDIKGKALKKGDLVWVKCVVKDLTPDYARNNVTLEVVGEKGDSFKNKFVITSNQCQKLDEKDKA